MENEAAIKETIPINSGTMDIKRLKERFFNGETTIEEEYELRRWLQEENSESGHNAERGLLLALLPQESEAPAGLEERLSQLIDRVAESEKQAMEPSSKRRSGTKRKIFTIPKIAAYTAAAAAAIMLVCLMNIDQIKPRETFSDPKVAAVHIDETLALFAQAFNCGMEKEKETAAQIGSLQATIGSRMSEDIFK